MLLLYKRRNNMLFQHSVLFCLITKGCRGCSHSYSVTSSSTAEQKLHNTIFVLLEHKPQQHLYTDIASMMIHSRYGVEAVQRLIRCRSKKCRCSLRLCHWFVRNRLQSQQANHRRATEAALTSTPLRRAMCSTQACVMAGLR